MTKSINLLSVVEVLALSSGAAVEYYNELAAALKLEPVKRFADKKTAANRINKMVSAYKAAFPADAGKPEKVKNDGAPAKVRTPKAKKEKAPAVDIVVVAHTPPSARSLVNTAVHGAASKAISREALVTKLLAGAMEPPRSQKFDRNYVMGYIAHGLAKGYLKEVKAA